MSNDAIIEHCRTLSFEEKLALLGALWDEIEAEESERPLNEDERRFLDERVREIESDPRPDRRWEAVRDELLSGR